MFDAGLVDEVRALLDRGLRDGRHRRRARWATRRCSTPSTPAATADDSAEARELTFIGTRRYVRRQRSWFRRDHRIRWLDGAAPGLADAVLAHWRHVS